MAQYYDRYSEFRVDGKIKQIPHIRIPVADTDLEVLYKLGQTRLDILSQTYYNNPYHGFLILLANPEFGGLEFEIENNSVIRIPYPFESALERYENSVNRYKELYG
jgi:hypothetical protein